MNIDVLSVEEAVLGFVMLYSPDAMARTLGAGCEDSWFCEGKARTVWNAAMDLHAEGLAPSVQLVAAKLAKSDKTKDCSLCDLARMLECASPTTLSFGDNLRWLEREHSARMRSGLWMGGKQAADEGDAERERQAGEMIVKTFAEQGVAETLQQAASGIASELEGKGVAELGIPTGLVDLDRILGFLEPGELTVVAARPGCGKSSILRQISYAVAAGGRRVSLVSTEMGAREIVLAAARQISGVAWAKGRELPPSERDSFKSAVQRISTMAAMRLTEARQLVQVVAKWRAMMDEEIHPALFVVDYLQQLDAGMRKGETLAAAVGRITGELKAFAKDHRVVVLAAAQLNRESVKDGEPQLYHLRDSGAIEQDADRVIMLKLSDNDKPDERWATVEVFQRKNRNGPLGTCRLAFDRWTTKFTNYAP